MKLYFNGTLWMDEPGATNLADTAFLVGPGFEGLVDEVAVYDYELPPNRVAAHYQAAMGMAPTPRLTPFRDAVIAHGPSVYYGFNELETEVENRKSTRMNSSH